MKNELDSLPFAKVQELYMLRMLADEGNDMTLRTRLLKKCPALFDPDIWREIQNTFRKIEQHNKAHSIQNKSAY